MKQNKRSATGPAAEETCQGRLSFFRNRQPFFASPRRVIIIAAIAIFAAETALMFALFLFPPLPVLVEAGLHALLLMIFLLVLLYVFLLKPANALTAEQNSLEKMIGEAEERLRKRIGQRLHGHLGQILTGVAFQLKVLEKKLEDPLPEEARYTAEISSHLNKAAQEVHHLAKDLHSLDAGDKKQPVRER